MYEPRSWSSASHFPSFLHRLIYRTEFLHLVERSKKEEAKEKEEEKDARFEAIGKRSSFVISFDDFPFSLFQVSRGQTVDANEWKDRNYRSKSCLICCPVFSPRFFRKLRRPLFQRNANPIQTAAQFPPWYPPLNSNRGAPFEGMGWLQRNGTAFAVRQGVARISSSLSRS